MPDDVNWRLKFDADEADARREGEKAGGAISDALAKALRDVIGPINKLSAALSNALKNSGAGQFKDDMADAARVIRSNEAEVNALERDMLALKERTEAYRDTLVKIGADPNAFAVVNRELERLLATQRELAANFDNLKIDSPALKKMRDNVELTRATISREIAGVQSIFKAFTAFISKEATRQTELATNASRERQATIRRESVAFNVITQQQTALRLAATRAANAQQLNADKEASRLRVVGATANAAAVAAASRDAGRLQLAQLRTTSAAQLAADRDANRRALVGQRATTQARLNSQKTADRLRVDSTRAAANLQLTAERDAGRQLLAETRGNNASRLNAERASSRTRIELLRFTLKQVQALERSIGSVFKGTASVISGGFAKVGDVVKRTGSVFRAQNSAITQGLTPALLSRERSISRSFRAQNNSMTQGLAPALLSRERSISRSFHSQETLVRGSAARQAAALQQLNAQASRGVAGAVSGRSGVGSLLGGGLAFGGIFTLITKLKQGFSETVNLNESLNKTRQIFGDASADIETFAANSVEALFVTNSAALEAAANFGIFGKAAGLAGQPLADFSKRLTVLATDLASFNNTSIADATTAISAALRGESEPIRKYGVLLNEAVLQQRALDIGVTDTIRKLQPFERVLAANAEILAQTAVQQGDAARTADQFANSSRRAAAASVVFFASIAKVAVPLATVITNGLFPAFQNMTKFILGDVGPALLVVRSGAVGAAAGIGALLIAKSAGEALKFLAISLKFVLTPMGLLVVAVAGIGAAINILRQRSPELQRTFDKLRGTVGDLVASGLQLMADLFGKLASVLADRLLPAIGRLAASGLEAMADLFAKLAVVVEDRLLPAADRLARFIGRNLESAFRDTVEFISTKVLPVIGFLARFVREEVVPAFQKLVDLVSEKLVERLRKAREALERFFTFLRPALEPAIAAFRVLDDAIRAALAAKDFSAIGRALRDAFRGVVETLSQIGDLLAERWSIGPLIDALKQIGSTVTDLFSGDFSGALDRLRDFGREATLVAAAIGAGLLLAFVNPFLGIGVAIAGIMGVALGPRLIDALRPQAKRFGIFLLGLFDVDPGGIAETFLKVVRRIGEIIGSIVTDARFVAALGAIVVAAVATAGAFVLGFAKGVADNLPELARLLGKTFKTALTEAFKFAFKNPDVIVKALAAFFVAKSVLGIFSSLGANGAKSFHKTFASGLLTGARNNDNFFRGLVGGTSGIEAAAANAAARYRKSFTKAFQSVNRDLVRLGETASPTLQGRDALGRFTGITEESLTRANTKLDEVRQRLGAAATEGALFRSRMSDVFKSTATAAGGFVKILQRDIPGGMRDIKRSANVFKLAVKDMFTDARASFKASGIGAGQAIGGAILSGVGSALSGQALGNATSAGGAAIGLSGIIASALFAGAGVGGGVQGLAVGGTVAAIGLVTAAFTRSGKAAKEAKDRIEGYAQALLDIESPAEGAAFAVDLISDKLLTVSDGVPGILRAAGISIMSLGDSFAAGTLNAEALEARIRAIPGALHETFSRTGVSTGFALSRDAQAAIDFLNQTIGELQTAASRAAVIGDIKFDSAGVEQLSVAFVDAAGVGHVFEKQVRHNLVVLTDFAGNQHVGVGGAAAALRQLQADNEKLRLDHVRDSIDDVSGAIDTLNQQRTDRINGQLDKISEKLGQAKDAAQLARDAVGEFFTSGFADTAQAALDNLVNNLPSLGQAFGEADKLLASGTADVAGESAMRTAANAFLEQADAIAAKAFAEDQTIDAAGLLAKFDPVFKAIKDSAAFDAEDLFTDQQADGMIALIQGKLSDGGFQAAVDTASSAQKAADDLQTKWTELKVKLETDVKFSRAQIVQALTSALSISSTEAAKILDDSGFTDTLGNSFNDRRLALTDGIVAGIDEGTPDVLEAVSGLAEQASWRLTRDWGISSPSKVFKAMGIEVPAGIVEGILAGAPDALVALRGFSTTIFRRLVALPGDLAENFRSILTEIDVAPVADVGDSLTDIDLSPLVNQVFDLGTAMSDYTQQVFDALAAMEEFGAIRLDDGTIVPKVGVDLSGVGVGTPEGANPLSNAGRVAQEFADALAFKFNSSASHPPGWVQTEDGTWVPPSFFTPAPMPPTSLDVPEAPVDADAVAKAAAVAARVAVQVALDERAALIAERETNERVKVRIENLNINETADARATGRETVMALTAASLGA